MVADELQYVLDHAGVHIVLAEDQEQVDKVLEIQEQCPELEQIIYDDERGMRDYDHTHLHSFKGLQDDGRKYAETHPEISGANQYRLRGMATLPNFRDRGIGRLL